ncbi:MAG: DNA polymerase III subunit gamma/tau, partial [Paracoccaceae bacterium]
PDPETLIKRLQSQPSPAVGAAPAGGGVVHAPATRAQVTSQGQVLAMATAPVLATFEAVVALIREKRDMTLLVEVETNLRLVRYSPGRIEFEPGLRAAPDLAARLGQRLQGWTGTRWAVSVVSEGGAATIAETRDQGRRAAEAEALQSPLVQAVLAAFPGAKITDIRSAEALVATAAVGALPEVEDEWDPFEDD